MIDTKRLQTIKKIYHRVLEKDVIPFWLQNSLDEKNGGYYNYLDRDGEVLSRDKSVWLQNREMWFFSKIYNEIEHREDWKDAAALGYNFIGKHCLDNDGRMFFLVDEQGRKLRKRRYWLTDTFAVLGFSQYSVASGDYKALRAARRSFDKIIDLYEKPEGLEPKFFIENRSMKALVAPMLLMSTAQEIRQVDKDYTEKYNKVIDTCICEVKNNFYKKEEGALLETVLSDGQILNNPEGRIVNPGHSIETSWFLMNEALYRKDKDLFYLALEILNCSYERGWDNEYGGILTFTDLWGKPSPRLEWDMKFWWTHTESLFAMLLAYIATQDDSYLAKYEKLHKWTFDYFPDCEYGEWFGYLHRDGSISSQIKGSEWKGTLHLPRLLLNGINCIDNYSQIGAIFG